MSETRWTRRELIYRAVGGAALLGGGSLLVSGCSRTDQGSGKGTGKPGLLAQLKSKGTITVGFAGEVPYAYLKGGDLVGEAPAVHKAIWKAEGIDNVKGVQVDFDQLIPGLNAKRFDAVAAGMFILPERCAQAAFSEPVYVAPEGFLVPKGNPKNITDFKSVKKTGIKLGVEPGTSERQYVKQLGIPDSQIVEINGQRDALAGLKAGRVEAFSLTTISLNNILKQNPDAPYEVVPKNGFTPVIKGKQQIGAGASVFRKADKDVLDAFNKQLAKLRKSGQLLKLIEPYGFGSGTIPPDDLTTASLCQG